MLCVPPGVVRTDLTIFHSSGTGIRFRPFHSAGTFWKRRPIVSKELSAYPKGDIKNIEKELAGSGEAVLADGSIGKQGMHSTGFSSIMHNLIGQYTLSMKGRRRCRGGARAVERGEEARSSPWRIRWGLSSANAPAPTG